MKPMVRRTSPQSSSVSQMSNFSSVMLPWAKYWSDSSHCIFEYLTVRFLVIFWARFLVLYFLILLGRLRYFRSCWRWEISWMWRSRCWSRWRAKSGRKRRGREWSGRSGRCNKNSIFLFRRSLVYLLFSSDMCYCKLANIWCGFIISAATVAFCQLEWFQLTSPTTIRKDTFVWFIAEMYLGIANIHIFKWCKYITWRIKCCIVLTEFGPIRVLWAPLSIRTKKMISIVLKMRFILSFQLSYQRTRMVYYSILDLT